MRDANGLTLSQRVGADDKPGRAGAKPPTLFPFAPSAATAHRKKAEMPNPETASVAPEYGIHWTHNDDGPLWTVEHFGAPIADFASADEARAWIKMRRAS